jgi:hypothetical protein
MIELRLGGAALAIVAVGLAVASAHRKVLLRADLRNLAASADGASATLHSPGLTSQNWLPLHTMFGMPPQGAGSADAVQVPKARKRVSRKSLGMIRSYLC